jgi:hypothetical protein
MFQTKLPKVNERPTWRKFGQSGHPGRNSNFCLERKHEKDFQKFLLTFVTKIVGYTLRQFVRFDQESPPCVVEIAEVSWFKIWSQSYDRDIQRQRCKNLQYCICSVTEQRTI